MSEQNREIAEVAEEKERFETITFVDNADNAGTRRGNTVGKAAPAAAPDGGSAGSGAPKGGLIDNFGRIMGGTFLNAESVRRNIWLIVMVVSIVFVYVAFRYQGQQDFITIDRLERELKDARYKALTISSRLTERTRESRVMEMLHNNADSMIRASDQPPFIIQIEE